MTLAELEKQNQEEAEGKRPIVHLTSAELEAGAKDFFASNAYDMTPPDYMEQTQAEAEELSD